MNFLQKKRIYAVLLLLFLVLLFYKTSWAGRWIYPVKYSSDIQMCAADYKLDPYLISSIIRVESNFKSDLISKKGAIGLMQIMPDTAGWIMKEVGDPSLTLDNLANPEVNIKFGSWYLRSLSEQYSEYIVDESKVNQIAILAAAYNAGPGNVKKWLNSGEWNGQYETIQQIPYGETRHYIQRVLYYYKKYVKYYASFD